MTEEQEEKVSKVEKQDLLGKLESYAKILASVGVIFGSIAIPYFIAKTSEQSHRAQVYMQIMSEREKADTAIRQEMFKTLLVNYLGRFEDNNNVNEGEESFRKRIMFLDLLNLNFQEYLNAKPLFEDIYSRLEKANKEINEKQREDLKKKLIRVANNVASRQSAMLTYSGHKRTFELQMGEKGGPVCIRLYSVENLTELTNKFEKRSLQDQKTGGCTEVPVQNAKPVDKGFPAVEVELVEVNETSVRVKVTPHQESFDKNGTLNFVRADQSISFDVSYFDLPYMDNTRLFNGSRFALILSNIYSNHGEPKGATFNAIIFKEDFTSLRDRPFFEEMLKKLNKEGRTQ